MRSGQIVALVFAVLLLLPGSCFLWVGIHGQFRGDTSPSGPPLIFASVILAPAALLFWIAFRRR